MAWTRSNRRSPDEDITVSPCCRMAWRFSPLARIAFARISAPRGQLTADMVTAALEPDPYDVDVVDLVALENTHQIGGGTVMPVDEMRSIRKVAQESGVPVYLDGARIFNASV